MYRRDCTACNISKDQLNVLKFSAYIAGCLCRQETGEVKNGRQSILTSLDRKLEEKMKRG
jgi:hypothetical protein